MIETVIISLTMAFCGKIMTEERAAVLIDNSYLRKEVLDVYKGKQGRFRLDYVKFSNSLCRDIDASRLRTYIYDCQFKEQEAFFTSLNLQDSFEVRLGELKAKNNGDFTQKQVDVLMVIDMIQLSLKGKVQHIILVSGDSDFIPAVRFIKEEGVKVHLRPAQKDMKLDLAKSCDTRKALDNTFMVEWINDPYS
jgi:uncharacterized LabA/DUF88 family protein